MKVEKKDIKRKKIKICIERKRLKKKTKEKIKKNEKKGNKKIERRIL